MVLGEKSFSPHFARVLKTQVTSVMSAGGSLTVGLCHYLSRHLRVDFVFVPSLRISPPPRWKIVRHM